MTVEVRAPAPGAVVPAPGRQVPVGLRAGKLSQLPQVFPGIEEAVTVWRSGVVVDEEGEPPDEEEPEAVVYEDGEDQDEELDEGEGGSAQRE